MAHASTLCVLTARENVPEVGSPVVTVRLLDWVVNAGLAIDAVTRTEVCCVPELTIVCTVPSGPEFADAGANATPPTFVLSTKFTATFGRGAPVKSTTLNT